MHKAGYTRCLSRGGKRRTRSRRKRSRPRSRGSRSAPRRSRSGHRRVTRKQRGGMFPGQPPETNINISRVAGDTIPERTLVMSRLAQLNRQSHNFWSPLYQNAATATVDFHRARRDANDQPPWAKACKYAQGLPDEELVKMFRNMFQVYGTPELTDFGLEDLLCVLKSGKSNFVRELVYILEQGKQTAVTRHTLEGLIGLLRQHRFEDILLLNRRFPALFNDPTLYVRMQQNLPPDVEVVSFLRSHSEIPFFPTFLNEYLRMLHSQDQDLDQEFIMALLRMGVDLRPLWESLNLPSVSDWLIDAVAEFQPELLTDEGLSLADYFHHVPNDLMRAQRMGRIEALLRYGVVPNHDTVGRVSEMIATGIIVANPSLIATNYYPEYHRRLREILPYFLSQLNVSQAEDAKAHRAISGFLEKLNVPQRRSQRTR